MIKTMKAPDIKLSHSKFKVSIGQVTITGSGLPRDLTRDIFHYCVTTSWSRLLLGCLAFYLVMTTLFFLLYAAVPGSVIGAKEPNLADLMFYSMRVFGTAAFGAYLPGNLYGEVVATVEIIAGIICYSLMVGLFMARFMRPQSQVLFAQQAVIVEDHGKRILMIRAANKRHNFMSDASAKLWMIAEDRSDRPEIGTRARRYHRLSLIRDSSPIFALIWTLQHEIDDASPLHGMSEEDILTRGLVLVMVISGHDEDFSTEVQARHIYKSSDIRLGCRYVDIINPGDGVDVFMDFSRIHDIEPTQAAPN
jgi:inward rectifier potassium channel